MKSLREQLDEGADRADLTPMLDCVFVLLLFLIVAMSFSEGANVFDIKLPQAARAATRTVDDAVQLGIDRSGRFTIAGEFVPDEELFERLRARVDSSKTKLLVIAGDKGCPYEKVVLAMDMVRALKLPEVSFVVETGGAK